MNDTISTAKTRAPFIKGPIKVLTNWTEFSYCRKMDKVLRVEMKAYIDPVYVDESFLSIG